MNKVFISHMRNVFPIVFAQHEFFVTADKQIGHRIDGRHVATVPPEGWTEYAKEYPEMNDVISTLRIAPAPVRNIGPVPKRKK